MALSARVGIHQSFTSCGALSARSAAVGRNDGTVEVFSTQGRRTAVRSFFPPGSGRADALAFSPDGSTLAILGQGQLFVWDLEADAVSTHRLEAEGGQGGVWFSSEGMLTAVQQVSVMRQEPEPDGMVRTWTEPAMRSVVVKAAAPLTRVSLDGAWEAVPNVPGLVRSADGAKVERWIWRGAELERTPLPGASVGRVRAVSPAARRALVEAAEGPALLECSTGAFTALAEDARPGDVLGFVDEETLLIFDRGVVVVDQVGASRRLTDAPPGSSSQCWAATREWALERLDHEVDRLCALDGSARVLELSRPARSSAVVAGEVVLSFTPSQGDGAGAAGGAFVHDELGAARELEGSRAHALVSLTARGGFAVGVTSEGAVIRWRLDDGSRVGEALLFEVEAREGIAVQLTLDPTGTHAVEQNRLLRLFELETFTMVHRFPFQERAGEPPVAGAESAEDEEGAGEADEAAWDEFFALREHWNPGLSLSEGCVLSLVHEGVVHVFPRGDASSHRFEPPLEANAIAFDEQGSIGLSLARGARVFSRAGLEQLAQWERTGEVGRVAALRGPWMLLVDGDSLEVCDALTGATRWSARLPPSGSTVPWEAHVSSGGEGVVLASGARVMHLTAQGETRDLAVLSGGEFVVVDASGARASAGALVHAFVVEGSRVVEPTLGVRSPGPIRT